MKCLMLILTACRLLLQLPRINLSGAYRAFIGRPLGAIFGLSDKLIGRLAGTGFKLPAPDLTEAHPHHGHPKLCLPNQNREVTRSHREYIQNM